MKVYKITTADATDYRGQKYAAGELCPEHDNPNFRYRAYHTIELATLFHHFYDAWENPILWEAEGFHYAGPDDGIMCAFKQIKLIREVPFIPYSVEDHIRFGIYCSLAIIETPSYVKWAKAWVRGERDLEVVKQVSDAYEVGEEFSGGALGVFESILQPEQAKYYAACGAYKAYHDSECHLNLQKIAEMVRPR